MKDRLLKFMQSENISAGKLAEIIGVQPSAISHIMSGRNKPGFDFLANLFDQFPNLNPRWIITGKDSMILPDSIHGKEAHSSGSGNISHQDLFAANKKPIKTTICEPPKSLSKSIEKIVIFYTDGTFSLYE